VVGGALAPVEGEVADDRIEIGQRLGDLAILGATRGEAQPGFLDDVLGAGAVAHDPVGVVQQPVAMLDVGREGGIAR